MRIGTALPQRRIDASYLDVARECEDLGFHGVSVFDHVIPLGAPEGTPVLESFSTLAAVAAVTSSLHLVTLVVRAAMRPPVLTAHAARSVRAVAGDRFVLGLGAGDASSRREDDLLGQPHLDADARRDRVVATVDAVRGLVPGLRVWLGGKTLAGLAEEVADGWNGWAVPAADIPRLSVDVTWAGQVVLGATRTEADERLASWHPGRDPKERDLALTGTPDDVVARLRALSAAGVVEAYVAFVGGEAATQRRVFAAEVLPHL